MYQGHPVELVHTSLISHLESYGLSPISVDEAKSKKLEPKFVWMEMIGTLYPTDIYGINCLLKNLLDSGKRFMCRKTELYFAMPEHVRKTSMADTAMCTTKSGDFAAPSLSLEGVVIVKPGEATAGIGITVLQDPTL